jgi:acyl carrier protein
MVMDLIMVINQLRANKDRSPLPRISPDLRLREDCELDSLDLAELTVRIEDATGIDVFANGLVRTVGEVQSQLPR